MRVRLTIALLLSCAACSQENAPAEQIAEKAEEIVTPSSVPTPLAKGPYAPQDSCAKVEGADAFRRALADAVTRRDADALTGLAAVDVKLDFGGGAGRAELRKRLGEPSRALWSALDELMTLGCSANSEGGVTIPWYFDQPMPGVEPMAGMLVTGENVPVRARPDHSAPQTATVSWDMVEIAALQPDAPFQQVKLASGTAGFVASDKLRSVLDYRLIASSRNGRWSITSFVAGD